METNSNSSPNLVTPETVSPTANWAKPTIKKSLKLKRKLRLRQNDLGERSTHQPTEQPKLTRIHADQDELLEAISQIKDTVDTTRRLHARIFNGLEK